MMTNTQSKSIVTAPPPARECSLCLAPEGALVRRHRAKPDRWIDGPRYILQAQETRAEDIEQGLDPDERVKEWGKEWSPFLTVVSLAPAMIDGSELLLCEHCRR